MLLATERCVDLSHWYQPLKDFRVFETKHDRLERYTPESNETMIRICVVSLKHPNLREQIQLKLSEFTRILQQSTLYNLQEVVGDHWRQQTTLK
jgi:hypothetical protein